ncbi:MAG: GYD domain-containing protein [Actinomycetota bacterium]
MPKYLLIASYTAQGAKGLLEDGGSKRRKTVEMMAKDLGGKVESFYFGFGSDDVYVIIDVPDHASAAAASLVVSASGGVSSRTVVLLTPEEMDDAAKKSEKVGYKPPGT